MKYHFKIHKEGTGFWAECMELSGCFTQADSKEKLFENMQDVLNLFIEESENSKKLAPLPDDSISSSRNVIEVPLDPKIAFSFLVRYHRIKSGLTQKEAANILGFENLYSYQRLESKKCNPTLKVISRIKKAFPKFSVDYAIGF